MYLYGLCVLVGYISFYKNSVYPTSCRNKVLNRKTPIRSYYFDMTHLANYWGCDGSARRYFTLGNRYNLENCINIFNYYALLYS